MQPMPHPQPQNSSYNSQGKSQQATSRESVQFDNRQGNGLKRKGQSEDYPSAYTGNTVGAGAGVRASTPITPVQHSINSHPNHNPASVHYGDRGIRVDQLQAPRQVNQFISKGSNSLQELGGGTCKAQNRTRAMQPTVKKAVKNGRRASKRVLARAPGF